MFGFFFYLKDAKDAHHNFFRYNFNLIFSELLTRNKNQENQEGNINRVDHPEIRGVEVYIS